MSEDSDDSIRIQYNEKLKPLEVLLAGVLRSGSFYTSGSVEIPMPKIEIEGMGTLSFPVPASQTAALIALASRAPYGRGEKTILDQSVRKVWQLPAEKIRIGGKSWAANFDAIIQRVATGLGCESLPVAAELYKLLAYDKGSFFLGHRDTEKTPGMFGTLVIALPSVHQGGELLVHHGGREVAVDMSSAEPSELAFAAFYADCKHEVRPITEGNRVCLVYNLIQKTSGKAARDGVRPPDYEQQVIGAAKLIEKALKAGDAPTKIAWLLEHQYSPAGLAFSALKGADAARAGVLARAAQRAGCAVHLGIVHIEESGAAMEEYDDYRRGRHGGYDDYEDDDESATSSANFEVIEVSDSWHYVDQWRDLEDRPAEFGQMPLQPGELLPAHALDDEEPDEQRLMEASGNEGATFERSYLRAAVVIWRRERYTDVLLQAGVEAAIPYLEERVTEFEQDASAETRKDALSLARTLVSEWPGECNEFVHGRSAPPTKRSTVLGLLVRLGDAPLAESFIARAITQGFDGSENAALVAAARLLGAAKMASLMCVMVQRKMKNRYFECLALLMALTTAFKKGGNGKWQPALQAIATVAVDGLDEIGKVPAEVSWDDWDDWDELDEPDETRPVDHRFTVDLLGTLGTLGDKALPEAAALKLAARPTPFDPVTVIVPALALLGERGAGYRVFDSVRLRLWEHSSNFVLRRSEKPPSPPRDWKQDAALSCKCMDCRELQAFARDPNEQTHRFRVKKERRQHLHRAIEQHSLAMTHVTERIGSPQTLVCTKDHRAYEQRVKQYKADVGAMKKLVALRSASGGETAALAARLTAAIRQSGRANAGK